MQLSLCLHQYLRISGFINTIERIRKNTMVDKINPFDSSLLKQKTTDISNIGAQDRDSFNLFETTEQTNEHYSNTLGKVSLVTDGNQQAAWEDIQERRKQKYKDYRARLGFAPIMSKKYAEIQYTKLGAAGHRTNDSERGFGFLRYLTETGGIVFPYTPRISVQRTVNYQRTDVLQHNYTMFSYAGTPSKVLSVSGKFTATSPAEALYLLAVLCALSAWTKSETGAIAEQYRKEDLDLGRAKAGMMRGIPGMPPPPLYFSAYGQMMEYETPVLLTDVSYTFEDDIQYTDILLDPYRWNLVLDTYTERTIDTIECRLPSTMTISLQLAVAPNPKLMRNYKDKENNWLGFNVTDYKNGELFMDYQSGYTL